MVFTLFIVTSCIGDMLPTLGIDFTQPNGKFLVDSNYWYAHDADPLFMHPPVWMRIVTGLSAFVYLAFYLVLVPSLIKRLELDPAARRHLRDHDRVDHRHHRVRRRVLRRARVPAPTTRSKFLAFNLPYVLIPILLLIRMRKPLPFTRKF